MKKIIVFLFVISLVMINNKDNRITIPKDSIRYRIIANSNSVEDQKQKWQINSDLIPILDNISTSGENIREVRKSIKSNLLSINNVLDSYSINYNMHYGQNYFPDKEYNKVIYPEGYYESLVITIGDGLGDNWWCILFPPLCLMEAKAETKEDITYTSYVKEILSRY